MLPHSGHGIHRAWRMAANGRDAFSQSPATRWDPDGTVRYGAFMIGADLFDGAAFSVSPPEASTMDPQQRVLLEAGYAALRGAGLTRAELSETNTVLTRRSNPWRMMACHATTPLPCCRATATLPYLSAMLPRCHATATLADAPRLLMPLDPDITLADAS